MLMIGFFGNLPSERAIASRCADLLLLRAFLGYVLDQATPGHSSLSVIRGRLGTAIYQAALGLVLCGLREHGLLKRRHLGIDSSVIEANASMRELFHRNTEEQYLDYVKRLAAEAGIDPDDTKAVRRFDKKREGRTTSNREWVNPHDPDAKVGMTKHGACDMIYKPEHVTDLRPARPSPRKCAVATRATPWISPRGCWPPVKHSPAPAKIRSRRTCCRVSMPT
jgi:transposase